MKQLSVLFFLLFLSLYLPAQDKIPAFGTIDKSDLEMKDCDFDPGAEAVVLLNVGEAQYAYIADAGWVLETEYRTRIKILKESAKSYADVVIKYFNEESTEYLRQLSAITYNLDAGGNITESKLESKEKYKKNIDGKIAEASFAMPDVKVGSVIEYRYKLSVSAFGYIPAWKFQKHIPVKYSAYHVILPEHFQYIVQTVSRQPLEKKNTKSTGTWYVMHNVPGFKTEPLGSSEENYLQRIEFQLSKIDVPGYYYENSWAKIIERRLASENFGLLLKKNTRLNNELSAQLDAAASDNDKIRTVYEFVQRNMQWNGDFGIQPNSSFDINEAWDKKNGSIADINFILLKFLQKAGIDAKPLLVSTKKHGAINAEYPFINQFNAVMAYIKDGNRRYVLNAADKSNPWYLVPENVLYTNALVVDKDNGGLVGLNNDKAFQNDIFFTAYVEADGSLSGNASLTCSHYARSSRLNVYKEGKLKELLENNEGIQIKTDSVSLQNSNDASKPFLQQVQFSGHMQTSGGYYFLPLTVFSQLGKNPFTEENRVTNIDFTYPQKYLVSASYILPDDFVVEELPKNKKMMMPDSSIVLARMVQKENNTISFRFMLDINAPGYDVEDYPLIKEFFKKMYAILEERIVLKKK